MQKIRLVIRGWLRRREQSDNEFVTRNASWSAAPVVVPTARTSSGTFVVDTEGLTVAYLDDSGQLAHFLDTDSGDIVDLRVTDLRASSHLQEPRYRRVPSRSEAAEREDRRAFAASLGTSPARDVLARCVDAESFRRALAADRTIERAWYNFRNDRAIAAIEAWLETF